MKRFLRLVMGVGVIAILAPALALALPNGIMNLLPWSSGPSSGVSLTPAMAAVDRDIQLTELESTSTSPPLTDLTPSSTETAPTRDIDASSEITTTTAEGNESERRATDVESTSGDQAPTSTTETSNPPAEPSTTSASIPNTSETITGQACPCTVTGVVELKGEVSLQGDLIVEGGTLVARPGVNVNGNGFQIMFISGGKADFQGTEVFTWSDRGTKQNLDRDIVFKNLRRIMWMNGGGTSTLKYFKVADSGTSSLGDYPLHWHLNGNSTRGTLVEGVVVVNGKNHAYVPHGSHGIAFKDVIAKNTRGDAFWWDPPGSNESCDFQKFCTVDNSNDIRIEHALVDGVDAASGSRGFRLAGFLLGAGSGNSIRNSAAINVSPGHIKDCAGFQWPEHANGNTGGNVWTFVNNYSRNPSGCHGIFVWQNDSNSHLIDGFSGAGIDHGAYKNFYEYVNVNVPYFEVHAAGVKVKGGSVDIVSTRSHRSDVVPTAEFTGTSIRRFIVQNGNGEEPGHYVLNNTGLTCGDIEYENALSGTTVMVDGTECGT